MLVLRISLLSQTIWVGKIWPSKNTYINGHLIFFCFFVFLSRRHPEYLSSTATAENETLNLGGGILIPLFSTVLLAGQVIGLS